MTTIVLQLSPAQAIRLAGVADWMALSHADVCKLALRLFLRAAPAPKGE